MRTKPAQPARSASAENATVAAERAAVAGTAGVGRRRIFSAAMQELTDVLTGVAVGFCLAVLLLGHI